ncbi:hypothetical protein FBQ88_04895 [Gammaproteobacteria bacterium PRO2]|nr:hypothetical protein [Gammaproteobacteria bacterium PRO8]MDL1880358.1 hypothetical protein [Gammaproteobacteria bacterium PRO2]
MMRRTRGGWLLPLLALALLPVAALAAMAVGERGEPGITAHRLWTFTHLILFVFWLGADLGVVLAVRAAAAAQLSAVQRARTLELARAIDLAPRLAASLMLTVGGILTEYVGIGHPWWQMAAIATLGPVWAGLILVAWLAPGSSVGERAAALEDALRRLLIVAVPLSVAWSWFTDRLAPAPYVAAKLLLFALLMALSLRIRAAWRTLAQDHRDDHDHDAGQAVEIAVARLNAVLPLMLAGWVALTAAAWLGITRPGEALPEAPVSALVLPR